MIVVARLAPHGETLTRVGRDGIEIPRVGTGNRTAEDLIAAVADLQAVTTLLERHLGPSVDATNLRLRNDEEET